MATDINVVELRASVHEVLQAKETQLNDLRAKHESTLGELYGLLSRKRTHGLAFPSIDLENQGRDTSFESLDEWKLANSLDIGSSNAGTIQLPSLPPPSPPPGVTVFPDEVPDAPETAESLKQEAAASPIPGPRRASSRRSTPATAATPAALQPQPVAGPSRIRRSPTPPATASMSDVLPRSRRVYSPSLPPTVPDWVVTSNYAVAEHAPSTPPHVLMPLETDYAANLPPLPAAPTRSTHRRRRKDSKDEEGPANLYKLQASYQINPVSSALSRSTKCVLTSDWRIAAAELRHIRAMERIEQKKENGRWSLRQPKKLKTMPVRKAHWDYLLDEMHWMSVDFTEERRWKRVLAREFAYQIVEWHLSTPEDKAAMMVGERGWRSISNYSKDEGGGGSGRAKSVAGDADIDMDETDTAADLDASGAEVLEEMLPRRGKRGRGRPKRAGLDQDEVEADEAVDAQPIDETNVAPDSKPENNPDKAAEAEPEVDRVTADVELQKDVDLDGDADAEGEVDDGADDDGEGSADIVDGVIGLEDIPSNRDDVNGDADAEGEAEVEGEDDAEPDTAVTTARKGVTLPNGLVISERFTGPEQLTLIRVPLLDSAPESGVANIPSMEKQVEVANGPLEADRPLSFEELFPDLAAYAGPVPPERDQHGPKRLEEGHMPHHMPAHVSRIMDLEPVFVSMLQPGKNADDGSWDLHDGPWFEDPKGSTDMTAEAVAATSSIFHGRAARPPAPSGYIVPKPSAHHLRPVLVWTPEEDDCLKRLVSMYPYNWQLIADSFNSEVVTIPTERRLPYDCFERWDLNFGPDAERKKAAIAAAAAAAAQATATPAPTTAATAPVSAGASGAATPAVGSSSAVPPSTPGSAAQTTASGGPVALSSQTNPNPDGPADAPPPPGLSKREAKAAARNKYEGTKKAIRHQALYDSVRRLIRRREQSKHKPSVPSKQVISIHESHSSYLAMPILDPSTLSNQKHQADIQRQMQQQQAMQRNQYMQEAHRQRMNQAAMANAAQQQQQQQQQGQPQQGQQQQQQPPQQQQVRPGPPPGPQGPPGQMQLQGQPPRIGPNGQPMPPNMNMNTNQQMILGAVAAATAANRQNGSATPGGTPRPPPQQVRGPPIQQGQGQQVPVQQMQHVEAQMLAAQMMQARAQQAQNQRIASGGTPMPQPGNHTASPYQTAPELTDMMPNGVDGSGQHMHVQTSPAAMMAQNLHSSSPQGSQPHARAATMPMASTPHLRATASGSPQMGNAAPQQQQQPSGSQLNQALMSQIVAQIQASGGSPTPEAVRAQMQQYMRNLQAQQQQQQQQQQNQVGTPQQGQPGPPQQMGTPQMGMQGVPHFARSPSVMQAQMRHSPSQ